MLCDGCWEVTERKIAFGWAFIKFKNLKDVDLCPACYRGGHGHRCLTLQQQGL